MRKIFVDFEMNPVEESYESERAICNYEIIEIGAIMLDDNNVEIDDFVTYIKPIYNDVVEERIVGLTGITTEMLSDAGDFATAVKSFVCWCGSVEDLEAVYAWSDSDYRQIVGEIKLKGIEIDDSIQAILEHWVDFQKIFSRQVGLDRPMGLQKAVEAVGREFEGTAHDALIDAINTAALYVASNDDEEVKKMVRLYEKSRRPAAPLQTALGDIFNFGDFDLE